MAKEKNNYNHYPNPAEMMLEFESNNFQIYRRRNKLFGAVAVIIFLLIFGLEWKTYFIEKAIGHYLVWQNPVREKTGRRWQVEKKQILAGTRLEKISQEMRHRERQLESIEDFQALLSLVLQEKQRILPVIHFARLYETLPEFLQRFVIEPDSLIAYRLSGNLENVLFNRSDHRLGIYFLGRQDRILAERDLTEDMLAVLQSHGREAVLDVQTEARFAGRVFLYTDFYRRFTEMPYSTQREFLRAMPALVQYASGATLVAISNKIQNDLIEVAVAPDNFRAILYYIPEEWIIDFASSTEEEPHY